MVDLLASDPGAWNIFWWIVVIVVVGGTVLWGITTLLLREDRNARGVHGNRRPPS